MLLELNFITALCAIRTIVDSYNKDGYNFIREYWIKQGIKLLNKKISECSGSTIDLQFVSPEGNYEALVGPMENKET
jgi:hypothetical protein